MLHATKIRMNTGRGLTPAVTNVDEIYLQGIGFHRKEVIFDYLILHPGSICVGIEPYPELLPATSFDCEKYICSGLGKQNDRLLDLPIEAVSTEFVRQKTVVPSTIERGK